MLWFIIAAAIIAVDQLAKFLVVSNIGGNDCIHIIPWLFDFVYVKNTGAAFSILSDKTWLLGIISILFCTGVLVYWFWKRPSSTLLKTALVLLFAGAFGNAIDRVFRGFVVDFISTAFMKFPVFNVADIAITFGAIVLAVYLIFFDKDGKEDGDNNAQSGESEQSAS